MQTMLRSDRPRFGTSDNTTGYWEVRSFSVGARLRSIMRPACFLFHGLSMVLTIHDNQWRLLEEGPGAVEHRPRLRWSRSGMGEGGGVRWLGGWVSTLALGHETEGAAGRKTSGPET